MSAALQRVVVRMLYDPELVVRVSAGDPLPELTATERGWLDRVDRRAFGTDPLRPTRVLAALIEEFPVSSRRASPRGLGQVQDFFRSDVFHRGIMEGRPVWQGFVSWLRGWPHTEPYLTLEAAIARARRRVARPAAGTWTVASGCWPEVLPEGTLARWVALRSRVGGSVPALGIGEEHVVVHAGADGVEDRVEYGAAGFHAALIASLDPIDGPSLAAVLLAEGADPEDVPGWITEMVEAGWLVAGPT